MALCASELKSCKFALFDENSDMNIISRVIYTINIWEKSFNYNKSVPADLFLAQPVRKSGVSYPER